MNFNDWWDTRIDKHEKLFNVNPGLANFAYGEALALFEAIEKELDEAEKANSVCVKTAQEKADAAERMRELAGKEAARRREVEAQRDGLRRAIKLAIELDVAGAFDHMEILKNALAKLEE